MKMMKLRVKFASGQEKIELPADSTLAAFESLALEKSGLSSVKIFGGFPPKEIIALDPATTSLKSLGICSGDQVTLEEKKPKPSTRGAAPPPAGEVFAVGDQVLYTPTAEAARVTAVHHDDPPDPYYTVLFPAGNERQTTRGKLELVETALVPAPDWTCSICTLKNAALSTACAVCETPKPGANPPVAAVVPGGGTGFAELKKMPDDNSCLFHAVSYLLGKHGEDAPALRQVIANAVRQDPIRWNVGTLGKEPGEYITFITNPIRWGGQVELCLLCEHYKSEIHVTEVQSGRIDIYGEGNGYPRRVYMAFTGIHFDAIELRVAQGGAVKEAIPGDASSDAAVKTLTARLQAQGDFTDHDTMRLRCKTCGAMVAGDYEARLHSGTFNHTEFAPA